MNKRFLSMILVLCMVVTMLPVTVMAEGTYSAIDPKEEIIAFEPPQETEKFVKVGTALEDLNLPEKLAATVRRTFDMDINPDTDQQTVREKVYEDRLVDIEVLWASQPEYDMNTEGEYVFTPVIESYTVSTELPEVTVTLGAAVTGRGMVAPLSATTYNIWVGGVQVTDDNKNDVLGVVDGDGATVTYDSNTNTLTLDGATITTAYTLTSHDYGIYALGGLNLKLAGTNAITLSNPSNTVYGIFTGDSGDLVINEEDSGSLTITTNGNFGIYSNNLTINSGTITTVKAVIWGPSSVVINGGTVTSTEGASGITSINGSITIGGGEVTASGSIAGLYAKDLIISGGEMTASSDTVALSITEGSPTFTNVQVVASTNIDGSDAVAYNVANLATYKYIKVEPAVVISYDVWVGDVQVTDDNKDDVLGAADGTGATVKYDPTNKTLTLNSATINTYYVGAKDGGRDPYYGIYAKDSLNIVLWNDNLVTGFNGGNELYSYGIYTTGPLTISGVGSLNVSGGTGATSFGIYSDGNLKILSGNITASSAAAIYTTFAIRGSQITISAGQVSALAHPTSAVSIGMIGDSIHISGGTVRAEGKNGLSANYATSPINISGGVVTVSGHGSGEFDRAISGALTVTDGTVTAQSNSKALNGSLNYSDCIVTAGLNHDGTDAGEYVAENLATYKYLHIEPVPADTTAPTVTSVSVPANGTYSAGQNLDFTINFDENVTVTGTPHISLTVGPQGKQAAYVSGSGTPSLVFRYTVLAGDSDSDGISIGSLTLNGGTIQDAAGNNANLTLNGVGNTASILVDTSMAPSITGQPSSRTVTQGQSATFSVTANGTGLTYQWQVNTGLGFTNILNGSLYSGAMTTALMITEVTAGMNGYQYRAVVSGTVAPAATSNSATLMVNAAPSYTITANPTTKNFGSLVVGYSAPAAQTVIITNTGNSSVTLTQPTSTNYTIGTLSTTTLAAKGTATFTVTPKAGLAVGNHNETLTVNTNHSTNATVELSFAVTAIPTYTITASPTSKDFGSLTAGYSAPAAQTVTIRNTGNTSVTLNQPTSTNYTIGALSDTTLAVNGTATFTVTPKAGLAVGNHNETLTVSTNQSTNATIELSFAVTVAPTYTITASPTSKDFGSLTAGYSAPAAQTVTITNTGNSSVTLNQPSSTNYTIGTLSDTTLAVNGTATFTVAPKTGLAVGNYDETLTVSTNQSTSTTVELSFSVTVAPTYTITASPTSKDFGSLTAGYSAPAAQTVTIRNTGNSSVTLTQPSSTNYTIGTLSDTTLAANGTATFTVAPKTGLVAGNYNETLTVSTDHSTSATVELSFVVTAAPIYTITANPTTKNFGSLAVGYSIPAAQTVTITNTGNSSVTLTQPTSTNYTIGTLSTTTLASNGTGTFTVTPKAGLTVGNYNETLTVSTDHSTNATVELSFSVTAVPNYTVTFNPNGGTVSETSRSVAPSTAVGVLPIPTRSGSYSFDGWYTAASGGTQISASTTVSANVTYYAHWTYTDGGGSGSDSSSEGSTASSSSPNSSSVIVTPPTPDKPSSPTQGEIKVPGTVDSRGNVTATITSRTIIEAFDEALANAKKNGNEQNGITVVLRVDTGRRAGSNVTVNLPKAVQDTIIARKIVSTIVVVDNPDIRIGMDLETVEEINSQAKSDVNITATPMDNNNLTDDAKNAIGSRPVFDLRVNYGRNNQVKSFGTGSVSVAIPYTLGANEKAENVLAVYIDDNGKIHWLEDSVYDSVEKVLHFSTDHFSTYGVGYRETSIELTDVEINSELTDVKFNTAFTDITGHWAKDDIAFVVNRGLFSGTSETTFSPNTAMTRGMFVTVLGRLANADAEGYKESSFTDVKNDIYYMGYIEWASKNRIVQGISNGKFAPEEPITREQMAVIIENYVNTTAYTLPKVHRKNTFEDDIKISTYAKEAVQQMQRAGIISGKGDNLFDPQGIATRAEVSAVLRRFVELTLSRDTVL